MEFSIWLCEFSSRRSIYSLLVLAAAGISSASWEPLLFWGLRPCCLLSWQRSRRTIFSWIRLARRITRKSPWLSISQLQSSWSFWYPSSRWLLSCAMASLGAWRWGGARVRGEAGEAEAAANQSLAPSAGEAAAEARRQSCGTILNSGFPLNFFRLKCAQ